MCHRSQFCDLNNLGIRETGPSSLKLLLLLTHQRASFHPSLISSSTHRAETPSGRCRMQRLTQRERGGGSRMAARTRTLPRKRRRTTHQCLGTVSRRRGRMCPSMWRRLRPFAGGTVYPLNSCKTSHSMATSGQRGFSPMGSLYLWRWVLHLIRISYFAGINWSSATRPCCDIADGYRQNAFLPAASNDSTGCTRGELEGGVWVRRAGRHPRAHTRVGAPDTQRVLEARAGPKVANCLVQQGNRVDPHRQKSTRKDR